LIDLGFREQGGMGSFLKVPDYQESSELFYGRWAFNMSFFILVNVISLNVIFGIIIDTFAELRTE
jgi:hypothetical protein